MLFLKNAPKDDTGNAMLPAMSITVRISVASIAVSLLRCSLYASILCESCNCFHIFAGCRHISIRSWSIVILYTKNIASNNRKKLEYDIKMYIFAIPNNQDMKRYKVSRIIKLLEDDGWVIKNWKGDHRQFINPNKPGKVTVNGKPVTL